MDYHATMTTEPDQYDTPWKDAIERYFPEFMAFYFPDAHRQIDWSRPYTFLSQELQAITRDAEIGKRFCDKLVSVYLLNGQEELIYVHVEVQGTTQAEFAERMFVYNYRIYDHYRRPVASMAVLADPSPGWKPQQFGYNVLNCQMGIQFPVAKLQDYAGCEQALGDDPNPFALVTLAHLQTQATQHDPQARFDAKWTLVQLLYRRGWDKQRIIDLLFVIDWMMQLPDHFKHQLWQNIGNLEQEKKMAYVSDFERHAIEKGLSQGLSQGLQKGQQAGEVTALRRLLTKRFGPLQPGLADTIESASLVQIEAWFDCAITAPSLDAVFATPDATRH